MEIINEAGEIVAMRNFGVMTEDEFRRVLKVLQQEYPELAADEPIEFTGELKRLIEWALTDHM